MKWNEFNRGDSIERDDSESNKKNGEMQRYNVKMRKDLGNGNARKHR